MANSGIVATRFCTLDSYFFSLKAKKRMKSWAHWILVRSCLYCINLITYKKLKIKQCLEEFICKLRKYYMI